LAEKKLVATVLYIQHFLNNKAEEEERKIMGIGGGRWRGTFHLFDTWHRAHRISDSR
jgi:hypothetical protein